MRTGVPEPAIEDVQAMFPLTPRGLEARAVFFLQVKGDSMIDAGILDGDLALIQPQRTADNCQIVGAMIDGTYFINRNLHQLLFFLRLFFVQ